MSGVNLEELSQQLSATEILLRKLHSKDENLRHEAIVALGKVKNKRAINLLINALADASWKNRHAASESLQKIGEIAIQPLIGILNDDNPDVRYWAIEILGRLGGAGTKAIAAFLSKPERDVRLHVVKVIHLAGNPEAIEPLVAALGDSDWLVRKHAAEALESFGEQAVPAIQKAFNENMNPMGNDDICYWGMRVLGRILKDQAVPTFKALLSHEDKNIRFYAVTALGETRSPAAVDPLISSLADPSWLVRRAAFENLELIGEPAIPKIKEAFFRGNDDIKYWTVRLLGRIMKGEAVETLKKLLNTPQKEIRFFVVTALGETNDERAVPALVECFTDNYWAVRKRACEMVAAMKARAIPTIMQALENPNEDVRYWAIQSLGKIGGEAMGPLLELRTHKDNKTRLFAVLALGELSANEIIEPLIDSLGDEYWPVRDAAAKNLYRMGNKVIRPLIKAIGSENEDISYWALRVLQNFGDRAVQSLISALEKKDDELRKHAITALGKIGTRASVKPLIEILSHGVIEECEAVVEALSDIKNMDLIVTLLEAIAESEEQVISWIVQILSEIGETGKPTFFRTLKHPNPVVRSWVCKILSSFEGEDVFKALQIALRDPSPLVRKAAVSAIGEIGEGTNVVQHVVKMLADPDDDVRFETYRLLGKIGHAGSVRPILAAYARETEVHQRYIMDIFKDLPSANFMLALIENLKMLPEGADASPIMFFMEKLCDSPLKKDMLAKSLREVDSKSALWIIRILSRFEEESIIDEFIKLVDNPELVGAVVGALSNYMTSGNWVIRDKVKDTLIETGPKIIEPLLRTVISADELKKTSVFDLIEGMGEDIIPELQRIVQSASDVKPLAAELFASVQKQIQMGKKLVKAEKKVAAEKKTDEQLEDIMARMKLDEKKK